MEICGKIILEEFKCLNCGEIESFDKSVKEIRSCRECGALYRLTSLLTDAEYKVKVEYEMDGFLCLEQTYFNKCKNCCPAPYMYCKEHSSEEAIQKAKEDIESAKRALEKAENKLEKVEASRKNWIITDISGLNSDE